MTLRELQKLITIMTACVAALVLTASFAASFFFQDPSLKSNLGEVVCTERLPPTGEILPKSLPESSNPPQPEEVLGEENRAVPIEATQSKTETQLLTGIPDVTYPSRGPASHTDLAPPTHLLPSGQADLSQRPELRMRWDPVKKATSYHVRAWQFVSNRQVVLVDKDVRTTEIHVEPPYLTTFYWQVSALDEKGAEGHPAGPVAVELQAHQRLSD